MLDIWSLFLTFVLRFFRPLIKGFLRLSTRLCELQRICYGEAPGAPRTLAIRKPSLGHRRPLLNPFSAGLAIMFHVGYLTAACRKCEYCCSVISSLWLKELMDAVKKN